MNYFDSVTELETALGSPPLGVMMKSLDQLDNHCIKLLTLSPLAVLGYADNQGHARALPVGGSLSFAKVLSPNQLSIELPEPLQIHPEIGCGLLFFIPGLGETLRINGQGTFKTDNSDHLIFEVEEAFIHCAKALIRSKFWNGEKPAAHQPEAEIQPEFEPVKGPLGKPEVREILAKAPFITLSTWDTKGHADVSPKGDPPGFLMHQDNQTLMIPDRPGNRRTDTFHNLVLQPKMALLAFVPGEQRVLEISGTAQITVDEALRQQMAVAGKPATAALVLKVHSAQIYTSPALKQADIWNPQKLLTKDQLPHMGEVFSDHVKQSKQRGLGAKAVKTMVNKHTMSKGLEYDYKHHLY